MKFAPGARGRSPRRARRPLGTGAGRPISSPAMDDPYKVLGVEREASAETIRAAYRKLAKRHHPDLNPGKKDAEERFKAVNAAYAILGDAEKRARFDRGEI